jgi:hypothetical protein
MSIMDYVESRPRKSRTNPSYTFPHRTTPLYILALQQHIPLTFPVNVDITMPPYQEYTSATPHCSDEAQPDRSEEPRSQTADKRSEMFIGVSHASGVTSEGIRVRLFRCQPCGVIIRKCQPWIRYRCHEQMSLELTFHIAVRIIVRLGG